MNWKDCTCLHHHCSFFHGTLRTETIRLIRDGESRTATSTFTRTAPELCIITAEVTLLSLFSRSRTDDRPMRLKKKKIQKNKIDCPSPHLRPHELCESRDGRPGLPVPDTVIVRTVSVEVKQHWTWPSRFGLNGLCHNYPLTPARTPKLHQNVMGCIKLYGDFLHATTSSLHCSIQHPEREINPPKTVCGSSSGGGNKMYWEY